MGIISRVGRECKEYGVGIISLWNCLGESLPGQGKPKLAVGKARLARDLDGCGSPLRWWNISANVLRVAEVRRSRIWQSLVGDCRAIPDEWVQLDGQIGEAAAPIT